MLFSLFSNLKDEQGYISPPIWHPPVFVPMDHHPLAVPSEGELILSDLTGRRPRPPQMPLLRPTCMARERIPFPSLRPADPKAQAWPEWHGESHACLGRNTHTHTIVLGGCGGSRCSFFMPHTHILSVSSWISQAEHLSSVSTQVAARLSIFCCFSLTSALFLLFVSSVSGPSQDVIVAVVCLCPLLRAHLKSSKHAPMDISSLYYCFHQTEQFCFLFHNIRFLPCAGAHILSESDIIFCRSALF